MPLALLSSWKEGLIALLLLAFAGLWVHDRVIAGHLSEAKIKQAVLQANGDVLAKEVDKQTAAIKVLAAKAVSYKAQFAHAISTADSLRLARGEEHNRVANLQVPKSCPDALNFLSDYWRSSSVVPRQ